MMLMTLGALISAGTAGAQEACRLEASTRMKRLEPGCVLVLPDPAGSFTFEQVSSPAFAGRFTTSASITQGTAAVWMRITVWTDGPESSWYLLAYPYTEFALFTQTPGGGVEARWRGLDVPQPRLELCPPEAVRVTVPAGAPLTFYVRTATTEWYRFSIKEAFVRAVPHAVIEAATRRKIVLLALTAGAILALAVYNLGLFILVRDRSYLYYALSIALVAGYGLVVDDWLEQFFRANLLGYSTGHAFGITALVLFIAFTRSYLDSRVRFPRWDRALQIESVLLLLVLLRVLLWEHVAKVAPSFWLDPCIFLLAFVLLMGLGVRAVLAGYRPARLYLVANVVFIGINIVRLLGFGVLGLPLLGNASRQLLLNLGVVSQVLLFSVALASRVNILRDEVEAGRREAERAERRRILELQELTERKAQELEVKVVERTAEVREQLDVIAEKNRQITDSITYASRIQTAMLPSAKVLEGVEHFVLWRPRDVVSGDFYWARVVGGKLVLAVADCTGHGVPGALMSMLGLALLNEIVKEGRALAAGEVLDELRRSLVAALQRDGVEGPRDGMDVALCALDTARGELEYAGAYSPAYLVRTGQVVELKADRMPVGYDPRARASFLTQRVAVAPGDTLYLSSDGYPDQPGGAAGAKLTRSGFRALLLSLQGRPMEEQREALQTVFERRLAGNEAGPHAQIDDVLVVGVRIPRVPA